MENYFLLLQLVGNIQNQRLPEVQICGTSQQTIEY